MSIQDRCADRINLASLEHVPVVPGLLPPGAEAFLLPGEGVEVVEGVRPTLLKMSAKNLLSQLLSLSLRNKESAGGERVMRIPCSLAVGGWTSGSLKSVVFDQVLGEFVDGRHSILGRVASEDHWNLPVVGIDPVAELIDGARELIHVRSPATPGLRLLKDLVDLHQVAVITSGLLIIRRVILQEFHLQIQLILVVSLNDFETGGGVGETEQGRDCQVLLIFHFYLIYINGLIFFTSNYKKLIWMGFWGFGEIGRAHV